MSEGRVCYSLGHDVPLLDWRVQCPFCGEECRFVPSGRGTALLLLDLNGLGHIERCGRAVRTPSRGGFYFRRAEAAEPLEAIAAE